MTPRMFLLAALLLGCVGAAVAADLSREIVYRMADGRQYAVSNPQDVTSGIPLILYFHGINCGCTRTTGDILDAAAQQGFRALIGSVCGVNGAWDVNGNSDVDYTKRVINDIASRYSIDRSKVFLAGWSMGGMMTSHLACVDASFVAGVAMVSCGFGCSNPPVKTNIIGIQGIYDSVCSEWVTNAYNSWAPAMGCPAGSGDVRKQVCSGKKLDLHRVVGPHLYLDVADQVAFFKEIAGGSVGPTCTAPANPANGHFTCAGTTCTLICDNGFAATGAGQSTCVNGAWSSLPACVPSGAGSQACGLVSENNAMSLSCATGQVINAVEFASYGQPQGSCSASGIGACHAASSLSAVQAACAGKSSCSVNAANSVFGDPCPGTNKQLAVRAHCAAATTVCASGSEWATLTVTCPAGSNIMGVSFASYGTPATATCGSFATGACHAASSLDVVQKTCVGKNTCSFAGGQMNAAFGDPCSGTGKTLAIQALCS